MPGINPSLATGPRVWEPGRENPIGGSIRASNNWQRDKMTPGHNPNAVSLETMGEVVESTRALTNVVNLKELADNARNIQGKYSNGMYNNMGVKMVLTSIGEVIDKYA